jgi:hypothetical protein
MGDRSGSKLTEHSAVFKQPAKLNVFSTGQRWGGQQSPPPIPAVISRY